MPTPEELELAEAVDRVLASRSAKKLVVAGPGAGKTTLFGRLLDQAPGTVDDRLVLTFINNLKSDLERGLGDRARVSTLHGYCQSLLHKTAQLRGGLTADFVCYPGLAALIKRDWEWLKAAPSPKFVDLMRSLACEAEQEAFYVSRGDFYDAVDFDDSVYRVCRGLSVAPELIPAHALVLVDEFQDFNRMEAEIIGLLSRGSSIVIAGDDDQALYSVLRGASWDHIRAHYAGEDYEVFQLPFCMRCPEVIVGAINDITTRAAAEGKLEGRIEKPFRYFPPVKEVDSRENPYIDLVRTSVQSGPANYFGRYVEQLIRAVPEADYEKAAEKFEPCILVIGSAPYLPQVRAYLVEVGLLPPGTADDQQDRELGLEMIHQNPGSNLGWRIVLAYADQALARAAVQHSAARAVPLGEVLSEDFKKAILDEANALAAKRVAAAQEEVATSDALPRVLLTSFEGSKGLSAQHVVLVGLHDGDLPRQPAAISDIEICKFLVGLTRTKKKCTIVAARRFGQIAKTLSTLVGWIHSDRLNHVEINADYWRKQLESSSAVSEFSKS